MYYINTISHTVSNSWCTNTNWNVTAAYNMLGGGVNLHSRYRSNPEFWAQNLEIQSYAGLTCSLQFIVGFYEVEFLTWHPWVLNSKFFVHLDSKALKSTVYPAIYS